MEETANPMVGGTINGAGGASGGSLKILAQRMDELHATVAEMKQANRKLEEARKQVVLRGQDSPGYHQLTAFAISATDESRDDTAIVGLAPKLFAGGVAMLLAQIVTLLAVNVAAADRGSCAINDQCLQGFFCKKGMSNACDYCHMNPMGYAAGVYQFNDAGGYNYTQVATVCANPTQPRRWVAYDPFGTNAVEWSAEAVLSWCDICVFFDGDGVSDIDGYNPVDQLYNNVAMMGKTDWLAFALTGTVVGLAAAREVRDTMVCMHEINVSKSPAWRAALTIFCGVRRYLFLPMLVTCILSLVLYKGGDALSVCFNAVALLFLADIDNYAYGFGLTDEQRVRLETMGRIKMSELDGQKLTNSQIVHVVVVVLSLLASVTLRSRHTLDTIEHQEDLDVWLAMTFGGMLMPFIGIMAARIIEVTSSRDLTGSEKMKSIAAALGTTFASCAAFGIFAALAIS
jgi:hypothetical protein